jgi:fatty acid desaturase
MGSQRTVETFKRSDVPKNLLVGPSLKHLAMYTAIDWAIVIACWALMFNTSAYLYPIYALIIAGRFHAFGVTLHDLSHMGIKKKTIAHRIFETLLGYPIGTTINAMAYHHNRHHRDTLLVTDPYYKINKKCTKTQRFFLTFKKGILFAPFWICRGLYGTLSYFIPSMRTSYGRIFLQDVSGKDLTNHKEVIECAKEDIGQLIFHILLAALTLKFDAIIYAYYLVMPIGGILCIYRLLIEHEYDIVENRTVYTMIDSTFDHHLNLWGAMLFAPRNIGYHCMHHIHPLVGLHKLPELRTWYLENCSVYKQRYKHSKVSVSEGIDNELSDMALV